VGHPLGISLIKIMEAEILLNIEKSEESIPPIHDVLSFCKQLDLGEMLQNVLQVSAEIVANQTPIDEKKINRLMEQASILDQRSNSRFCRIDFLLTWARINLKLNKSTVAFKMVSEIESLYRELGIEDIPRELSWIQEKIEKAKLSGG